MGPKLFPPEEHTFFRSEEDTHATGLMFLAERFHHLLQAEDDVGIIVIDSRFHEKDARLRRFFGDLTEEGTPYTKLERIVEGLFLGPSHYSIGLQCADLVVAATAAAERGVGAGSGDLKKLLPRFARHPATGELAGVGLKRFPEAEPRKRSRTGCSDTKGVEMASSLPPRSRQLVEATPIHRMRAGVKPAWNSSFIRTVMPGSRSAASTAIRQTGAITQTDSLPLNHRTELEAHLTAILDRLESATERLDDA